MSAPFLFQTDMMCEAGGRTVNEDYCNFLLRKEAVCWVLADGLGGHGGGEVASQIASDTVLSLFAEASEFGADPLRAYMDKAAAGLAAHQASDPRLARMATTLVVLLSDYRSALWAHIGDSRLYHFRDGAVIHQTKDHSVAQALCDRGEIAPGEIRHHADRSSLRRSLGKGEPAVLPLPVALRSGDAFLLASDGFWEYVTETEMEVELSKAAGPAGWLQGMRSRLKRKASGDFDNYSAVAVMAMAGEEGQS
ncbi:MAG: serine/threonine-protein phosphatase [Acidimicrobiia bacterium]|nr:serine/threonine-protein phosphatase [Acidimicrobiia bacterium]